MDGGRQAVAPAWMRLEYEHIALGLIFPKYISDVFEERRESLLDAFEDEANGLYLPAMAGPSNPPVWRNQKREHPYCFVM